MAEIILGVLAILAGAISAIVCLISIGGNAMGGATAPDQVDHTFTIVSAILAVALFGAAGWLLI